MLPVAALGAGQQIAPGNRICVGFIGLGDMGTQNLNSFLSKEEVQVVALCDVDRNYLDVARKTSTGVTARPAAPRRDRCVPPWSV